MKRILIVDDVKTNYLLLKILLETEENFEVVGWSKDGVEAVAMTQQLQPDLITMDLEMPNMNGLEATRTIMAAHPTPIVVVSSYVNEPQKNLTYNALNEGALAVVEKPVSPMHPDYQRLSQQLIKSLNTIAGLKLIKHKNNKKSQIIANNLKPSSQFITPSKYQLLAIGSSAGGPNALLTLLKDLPKDFPLPIVIVQHIHEGFLDGLVNWLQDSTKLSLKIALEGEVLKMGNVYFAPDKNHLLIKQQANRQLVVELNTHPPINGFQPSVSVLFESIAKNCASTSIGGILTGMGNDGGDGLLAMRNAKSHTFIQDEDSALVYGMPSYALKLGAVEKVINLDEMANYLCKVLD
ncbi:MAG: chemotaxis-specific protein-glutamate methyltransferase CheB [Methylococcaceae bacterium]|nr:chemotaxis-specific protein-glutamate methyltransferase CheB [Methylococcaceae bacterium]